MNSSKADREIHVTLLKSSPKVGPDRQAGLSAKAEPRPVTAEMPANNDAYPYTKFEDSRSRINKVSHSTTVIGDGQQKRLDASTLTNE